MRRAPTADAARAALYALGALPPSQIAAFEERLRSSPALRAEVEALRATAAELALAAEPVPPDPALRGRVLARVAGEASAAARPTPTAAPQPPALPELLFALHADEIWSEVFPGIEKRELARARSGASYLLRLAPGTTIPRHDHRRIEHSFVLHGTVEVEGRLCHAGDYHRAAEGTSHRGIHSADGCVMLIVEANA